MPFIRTSYGTSRTYLRKRKRVGSRLDRLPTLFLFHFGILNVPFSVSVLQRGLRRPLKTTRAAGFPWPPSVFAVSREARFTHPPAPRPGLQGPRYKRAGASSRQAHGKRAHPSGRAVRGTLRSTHGC